jgi:alpha-galactosidase
LLVFLVMTLCGSAQSFFLGWAEKPPMGWDSWDCFASTVTEAQTKAQADVMAERLARYGWQYVVVDIQWYEPKASGIEYRKEAELAMDEFGRLCPEPNRFPSATNGAGFKPLSDYIHKKGLKFGLHMLRGVPRLAVARNLLISGSTDRVAGIADTNSLCSWNGDMYGVDMAKPGAQAYYNSVFALLAAWEVDFVQVDDVTRPFHREEIEAIRKAIDAAGRPMVLSLSPGEIPLAQGDHVSGHANLWRISDGFPDQWQALREQFDRVREWSPYRGLGHFPDAGVLPLGVIGLGRQTHFTRDEQYTLLSLWSITRSPLILGGDLTRMDDFTLSLLTNAEVLAVNQSSHDNHEMFNRDGLIAWLAEGSSSTDKYVGIFNTRDTRVGEAGVVVPIGFAELGLGDNCRVRDLWQQLDLGVFKTRFIPDITGHAAGLFEVTGPELAQGAGRAQEIPEVCYLFSYFVRNGEDGLHLAWSRDGYRWEELLHGRSFLEPKVGESKLMRDPCLLQGPEGTFHMVWTTAWNGKTIGHASSADLIHWSDQAAIEVMGGEPASLNCWAPEITWDARKEQFLIFWASTVTNRFIETAGQSEDHYNHRFYFTTTKDFTTFAPARVLYDPGFSAIDATILAANSRFYLIFKDETLTPPRKQLRMAASENPDGPYGPPGPAFTGPWVEGPTALRIGDDFIVYYDCYRDQRYGAMRSKDLQNWEDVTERLSMPPEARHGSVLAVPGRIIAGLVSRSAERSKPAAGAEERHGH